VNLILFTSSYPCVQGGESNFLSVEIEHLSGVFERVIVVPETIKDATAAAQIDFEVDTSYARQFASVGVVELFRFALSSQIFRHCFRDADFPRFSFTAWRRLIAFAGKAELTRRWVLDFLQKQSIDPQKTLFYTYWFDHASGGIAFARKQHPEIRLITRAHGYDIFMDEYYTPPFFPCRKSTLPLVDRIFSASKAGVDYLQAHYPEFSSRITKSLLGVVDPGFLNQASKDGVFRIISCSMIRPEKRIEMIFDVVKSVATLRPNQQFEWIHVGNGVARDELQTRANREYPPNAKARFHGYSDHTALMRLYKEKTFDLFLNLSETEGTPVSIMEAISCGIPILATAVGGNTEIVSERNGILVGRNSAVTDIASAILQFADNPDGAKRKRDGSRAVWETQYNASLNFLEFAQILKNIRMES
jgi:colanic acid/amylovoran biosynthesis glycosyltransferase